MAGDARVLSYLAVRQCLGGLGLLLPVLLWLSAQSGVTTMQPTISDFYHTPLGDVLVGVLCAIGVFLFAYKGYARAPGERFSDAWVARLAGLGAIGVALLPVMPPDGAACLPGQVVTGADGSLRLCPTQGISVHWTERLSWLHFASAALFFVCMTIFCFVLFPKGDRTSDGSIDWGTRSNRIYRGCGIALVLCIALNLGFVILRSTAPELGAALQSVDFVFWAETLGVLAFAVSWLTKGRTLRRLGERIREGRAAPD